MSPVGRAARVLRKLRGRSLEELRERGGQTLSTWLERARLRDAREPRDADLLEWLSGSGVARTTAQWREHLRLRREPRFFAGFDDPAATITAIRQIDPAHDSDVLRRANDIIRGRFDLLAHRGLDFGTPIDWHLDPLVGVRAPLVHWSRIPFLDPRVAGDHKVVWELNRHQFFVTLGQAYWITGDELYAREFARLASAWMEANPPKLGINWASSLEVAVRAMSWLWALELFRRSDALDVPLLARITKYLVLHGRHLERHLSTWFSPNTHLTGEALGLFHLGLVLPELRQAEGWRRRGWTILLEQLPIHTRPDGVYFEQAVHYHRYTVDFYLHLLALAERNGLPGRDAIGRHLEPLLEHLLYLARPDGTVPMIGDEDGGKLMFLDRRGPTDVRSPLAAGAVLFGRPDFAHVAGAPTAELVWLLGTDAPRALELLGAREPDGTSRGFRDGGVYVMRDGWHAGASQLVVDCGPHGSKNCGHAHADALSFELTVRGQPILVEPGTYTYTVDPELRDWFRSTAAHNALSIDGRSSSEMAGPFQWSFIAQCTTVAWQPFRAGDYFEGTHDGYQRLTPSATYRRTILAIRDGYWVVRDIVESEGSHELAVTFQCAPDVSIAALEEDVAVLSSNGDRVLRLMCSGGKGRLVVDGGWVSPRYGVRHRASRCRYLLTTKPGRQPVTTFMLPDATRSEDATMRPAPTVRMLAVERGEAFELRDERFVDLLLFDAGGVAVEGVSTDARVAWVRRRAEGGGGEITAAMFVGGARLAIGGSFVLRAQDAACATRLAEGWLVEGEMAELESPSSRLSSLVSPL